MYKSHRYLSRSVRLHCKAKRYIRCNNRRRFRDLLTRHPELLGRIEDQLLLLQLVVWWQKYDLAEDMLRLGADPNLADVLISAAAENDLRMARLLLDFGADIEQANSNFETPLGYACSYDAVEVVQLLCERGADVNWTEGWGRSYLYGVQCAKQAKIEQILLAHGARVIEEEPRLKRD